MADQVVVPLSIDRETYQHLKQVAQSHQRSVEQIVVETINTLYMPIDTTDQQAVLGQVERLETATDEHLWGLVHRRMAMGERQQLDMLTDKSKNDLLNDSEQAQLDLLTRWLEVDMLLRSRALALLHARGYDVSWFFTPG